MRKVHCPLCKEKTEHKFYSVKGQRMFDSYLGSELYIYIHACQECGMFHSKEKETNSKE